MSTATYQQGVLNPSYLSIIDQGCQTQIPSRPKFKTGTKSSTNIDIYGINLPPLLNVGFLGGRNQIGVFLPPPSPNPNPSPYPSPLTSTPTITPAGHLIVFWVGFAGQI